MSKLDSELWQNIMHYRIGEFDRMPVIHWNCWMRPMNDGNPKACHKILSAKMAGGGGEYAAPA